jgi:hypothetical protein
VPKPHDAGCAWADMTACSGPTGHEWSGGIPIRCRFCFIEDPEDQCFDNACDCWCHWAEEDRAARLSTKLKANRAPPS